MASSYKIVSMNLRYITQNKDFDLTNGLCLLCKKTLAGQPVIVGKCHHAFHKQCVSAMPNKLFLSCPIDTTAWSVAYTIEKN